LEKIMRLVNKSKNAEAPATARLVPANDKKTFKLNKPLSRETINALASETLRSGGWIEPPPPEPKVGDKMPDGTVLAGISPDTNKPMYATPADASLTMTFNEAQEYASKLAAHGHKDWRVPTKAELNVLFNNRVAIGGLEISGSNPAGWYWSASPGNRWDAWCQRFSDGAQHDNCHKDTHLSVRPLR
jgi:hypothetical protein